MLEGAEPMAAWPGERQQNGSGKPSGQSTSAIGAAAPGRAVIQRHSRYPRADKAIPSVSSAASCQTKPIGSSGTFCRREKTLRVEKGSPVRPDPGRQPCPTLSPASRLLHPGHGDERRPCRFLVLLYGKILAGRGEFLGGPGSGRDPGGPASARAGLGPRGLPAVAPRTTRRSSLQVRKQWRAAAKAGGRPSTFGCGSAALGSPR